MMILLLLFLIIIPVLAYRWARKRHPLYKITILGIAFGSIVAPFSMGLYATFFLHPVGIVTGLPGLVLSIFHGTPGYELSIHLGLVPSNTVTTTTDSILIAVLNAFIWAIIYGLAGYLIDKYRNYRKNTNKSLVRDASR